MKGHLNFLKNSDTEKIAVMTSKLKLSFIRYIDSSEMRLS